MAKKFDLEWSGDMKRFISVLDAAPTALRRDIPNLTRGTLATMHNTAFKRARRDTRFMRNHFFTKLDFDGLGGKLYGTAEYTIFNEYGTYKMPARPAIRYAFLIHQKEWLDGLVLLVGKFG